MACSTAQSVKAASISDLEREREELERKPKGSRTNSGGS